MTLATLDLPTTWSALGWSTLHFLWQGVIIWLLAVAVLRVLRSPGARYTAACAALGACLLCFAATFFVLLQSIGSSPAMMTDTALPTVADTAIGNGLATDSFLPWADLAAWLWTLGALVMGGRFGWQWLASRRLRVRLVAEPAKRWQRLFESLKTDLGIGRRVRLLQSTLAEVPMVVGWLSPVIIIPATAFTSLTPEQLRMILAHELAHIRRHDHLVNMMQGVIEVILFFHPVTWWLSRQVRIEREHCCDDASVRIAKTPKTLIEALLKLESLRSPQPTTTLAATGGSLMKRVTRILGMSGSQPSTRSGWQALAACTAAVMIVALGTLAVSTPAFAQDKDRQAAAEDRPSFQMSEVLAKITMNLGSGELTPGQAAEYLVAAQQVLDSEEILREYSAEIKAAHQANEMTRKEAGASIKALQEELQTRMMTDARTRIGNAVKDGAMTRQEAGEIFAVYTEMTKSKQDDKKFTRRDYAEASEKMTEMVKSGEITREQMQQRLDRMRKSMAQPKADSPTWTKMDYAKAQSDMKKMVEAGEITEGQMNQRLDRMKAMMTQPKADSPALTRADYAKAQADMKKMVEAGEITREQMQQRLSRMTKMMDAGNKAGSGDARASYEGMKRRLDMAVETGRMTQEEADKKLTEFGLELRAKMAADQKSGTGDARATYDRMQRRFQMAVESGKMTQDEADQKMAEMGREIRMNMAAGEKSGRSSMNWDNIKRRIEGAVKNGAMTREQADALYTGLKARMAKSKLGDDGASRDEPADDCRALGMRLRQAVANGDMTADEAREVYEEECGGRDR